MDRCVLEGNPHLVLEGMIIGAWAIGASQGYGAERIGVHYLWICDEAKLILEQIEVVHIDRFFISIDGNNNSQVKLANNIQYQSK